MNKPSVAADIMVRDVFACRLDDNLARALELMKTHHIRHLPVLNEADEFIGLVTQRAVLKQTINAASKFGLEALEKQEQKTLVRTLMETGVETIQPQMPLLEAGRFFIQSKHGCLPVLDEGRLVGILTSADFVKLSVRLLESTND